MESGNKKNTNHQYSALIPDKDEEMRAALDLFGSGLVDLFSATSEELISMIDDYNGILMLLIDGDHKFKKDLENALYSNPEQLTWKEFKHEGRPVTPTIAKWINDFIKYYGSAMPDNLTVTKYITFSENAKKLDSEEKKLLTKLIKLYRNLKFFPESLKGQPENEWELIPVERDLFRQSRVAKATANQEINSPESPAEPVQEKLDEAPPVKSDKEIMLETLQKMAEKYAAGTIERRAVEEEIRKLGN